MNLSVIVTAVLAAPAGEDPSPRSYAGATVVTAPREAPEPEPESEPESEPEPEPEPESGPGGDGRKGARPASAPLREGVREVRVTTRKLGGSTREEAFRHAGGRTVVDEERWRDQGRVSFTEALSGVPGVRAVEGVAGVGSTSTKLNVGVRGSNPRLSSSATVMLDEIPLAMAPYGQPELSLFPLSLFSIERADVVRGGGSVRFGPQTAGGVFNLVSKPIPVVPTAAVAGQVDHFGFFSGATSFGTTVDRLGVYAEYAPQVGRSFRENSEVSAHGGLLKLAYALHPGIDLFSTTHAYAETSGIPGGLSTNDYLEDPFQSTRREDRFEGWRAGEAVKLATRPREGHAFDVNAFYNHTFRETGIQDDPDIGYVTLPRTYDAVGVEPRYTVRLEHARGAFHDLGFGLRGVLERAQLRREAQLRFAPDLPVMLQQDDDARLGAFAAFAEDELYLLDERLVLRGGLRMELARISRRNNLTAAIDPEGSILSRTYWELLPAASIWAEPFDRLALFAGYSRSFGPPTFVQIGAALNAGANLSPENTDTVEVGVKVWDFAGVYGDITGWFRSFESIRDVGLESVDIVGDAYAAGMEVEAGWEPGEVWDALIGSEVYAGLSTMDSIVHTSLNFEGKELPWYPELEVWAGLEYAFPWRCGLFERLPGPADCRVFEIGGDIEWASEQYSEFTNDARLLDPGTNGGTGIIPAYTLVDVFARFRTVMPGPWALDISVGVKNVLDERWFYRTDDRNAGVLVQRPRTFYVNFAISHMFVKAQQRAERRRERRRARGGRGREAME